MPGAEPQISFDGFSPNWPNGPIQSYSCNVHLYVPSRKVPFKRLFAPIYKGPRSNFVEFLNYSGKSYRKEVVSYFAIFAQKWSKIAARKKVYFGLFLNYHFTGLQ